MVIDSRLVQKDAPEVTYVEEFVKYELRSEMAFLNEDNNSRILSDWENQRLVQKWMYSYQSTAWILVRGAWFFDFMGHLFKQIVIK